MAFLGVSRMFSPIPTWWNNSHSFGSTTLDASGDKYGTVFQMREAATLTHGGFRYATRTGTPPTYRLSLQALTTGGLPDGTPLASVTFTPPASTAWNSTWQWQQFDVAYAASVEEFLALVIDYSSGTINGSNNGAFSHILSGARGRIVFPYCVVDTTGSYAKTEGNPLFAVKSGSMVYGFPCEDVLTTAVTTSGHRATKKFTIPSSSFSAITVCGIAFVGNPPTAGNSWIIGIWNAAGTVLSSVTVDSDFAGAVFAQDQFEFYFDPVVLTPGDTYYVGIQHAGANCSINSLQIDTSNEALAFPLGTGSLLSTWNGSAWSDTATTLPVIDLLISDWTSGGGSSVVVANNQPIVLQRPSIAGY